MILPISLIIPHQNQKTELAILLESLNTWTMLPSEIVIIDSSDVWIEFQEDFLSLCDKENVSLELIQERLIFPGHARNLGIKSSKNDLMAFLDVKTIPTKNWLERSYEQLKTSNALFLRGATIYEACSLKEQIILASTFGFKNLKTLPGSLIHKNAFSQCGLFIENVRAGEDGDWMSRAKLHRVHLSDNLEIVTYKGFEKTNIKEIVKKWYRNYKFTHHLPFFQKHKEIYFYVGSIFIIIVAQNWNWVSRYLVGGEFFIPNVTKISLFTIFLMYFIIRVIFLPMKKGAKKILFNPACILGIFFLSIALDIAKISAFISTKVSKNL